MTRARAALLRAMLASLVTIATTLALLILVEGWRAAAPATCLTTNCFCEAPRAGALLTQPANSWSSFAFVLVGWLILYDRKRQAKPDATATAVLATASIVTGIGSVLLHATLTLWGQFADVLGMYLLGGFMLLYAAERAFGLSRRTTTIGYFVVCGTLITILAIQPEVRRWLFLVVIATALIVELGLARPRRPQVRPRLLVTGMAANAVAFAFWTLDQRRILCDPTSVFQGHALWHLLGAVALWLTYRYYRSEQRPDR